MDIGDIADRHAKRIALTGGIFLLGVAGIAVYHESPATLVVFVGVAAYGAFRLVAYVAFIGRENDVDKTVQVVQPLLLQYKPEQEPEVETTQDDDRFFQFANRYIEIPETVSRKHLDMIGTARRRGDLPAVNPNRLNLIGISRFSTPPNAATTIDFLRRVGAIDEAGQWTSEADKVFAPPAPINGRVQQNVVV